MTGKYPYTKNAEQKYIERILKNQKSLPPACIFGFVKKLWPDNSKKALFMVEAEEDKSMRKGLLINFNSKGNSPNAQPLKILPGQFIDLINIKCYFDQLDAIECRIHGIDARKEIIQHCDNEMNSILQEFSQKYKKVKRPIFHIIDNNAPAEYNTKESAPNDEANTWKNLINKEEGDKVFFKVDSNGDALRIEEYINEVLLLKDTGGKKDKIFADNYLIVIDIVLGSSEFNGIDIVKNIRKKKIEYEFIPIVVVSKHFSDHNATDTLLMAKADWFISKGIIGSNPPFNKLEELRIISIFLDALRYREYCIHILLFIKFFFIYLYLKQEANEITASIIAELERINNFILWITGECDNKDFPRHKPHFINHIANNINKPINSLLEILENAIQTRKTLPEEVFKTITIGIYNIIVENIEPYSNLIDLTKHPFEKPPSPAIGWELPFKSGIIETNFLLNLTRTVDSALKNELTLFFNEVQDDEKFHIVWQQVLSNAIGENKKWR